MVSPSPFLIHIHFHTIVCFTFKPSTNPIFFLYKHILILFISGLKISRFFYTIKEKQKEQFYFQPETAHERSVLKYLCKSLIASTLRGLLWGLSWVSGYEVCKTLSLCGCCLSLVVSLSSLSFFRILEHWVSETYKRQARCVDNSRGTCHWSKWQKPDSSSVPG